MKTKRNNLESPLTLITPERAEALANAVFTNAKAKEVCVSVTHNTSATTRFAQNDLRTVESSNVLSVMLFLNVDGMQAMGSTTRTDEEGLAELVQQIEKAAKSNRSEERSEVPLQPPMAFPDPPVYFDSSISAGVAETQADIARNVAGRAEEAGLVGVGDLKMTAGALFVMNTSGIRKYFRKTYGEFSMTARTKEGTGSGWARSGREDFSRISPNAVADRAIELCKRSDKPSAVEPGRYTVILEPEALAEIMDPMIKNPTSMMSNWAAEQGLSVFALKDGGTKLAQKMVDERVQILVDPMDEELPFIPMDFDGWLFQRAYWHENGVLKNLADNEEYAKAHNERAVRDAMVGKVEIKGAIQTLEEMIASTKRGIWVHRVDSVDLASGKTLLLTGVTRDGTFLIENGKVTRPIKNLRFSESPFFILNKIDAFGSSVRARENWAVPRIKVHDFEFTSLSDAV